MATPLTPEEKDDARAAALLTSIDRTESSRLVEQQARYNRWRASVPWTNEQLAQVYDRVAVGCDAHGDRTESAAKVRSLAKRLRDGGRVSYKEFAYLLGEIDMVCGLCGKPAHYRMGCEGRCREHKMIPTRGFSIKLQKHRTQSADITREQTERDQALRWRGKHSQLGGHK